MSKEYFTSLQKQEIYSKKNQLFLKKRVLKTFLNLIEFFFNKRLEKDQFILDLGSADGTFVDVAKSSGFKALGLDINQLNLETDKISLENNSCDLITANSLIEHISNPENFLQECKRTLKDNGILIIVTPDWSLNIKNFYDNELLSYFLNFLFYDPT